MNNNNKFIKRPLAMTTEQLELVRVFRFSKCDLRNTVEVMFAMQRGLWCFTDDVKKGSKITFTDFTFAMARHLGLNWSRKTVRQNISIFWKMNSKIPRCGGILLNSDRTKMLVVKGYGSKRWSLPMGKIEGDEDERTCAMREVREETGYDGEMSADTFYYHQASSKKATKTLFVFYDVPDDPSSGKYSPLSINEIEYVSWLRISDFPKTATTFPKTVLTDFLNGKVE